MNNIEINKIIILIKEQILFLDKVNKKLDAKQLNNQFLKKWIFKIFQNNLLYLVKIKKKMMLLMSILKLIFEFIFS